MSQVEWKKVRLGDFAEFNPTESLPKGTIAKKIAMDKLVPFCRDIPSYELEPFSGGTKFRNGDTIMARITPCLENGKTSQVRVLNEGEIGFGSTEYIVFRAITGISDSDFLYYLVKSDAVREPAIKSMVGSSGRQRVQTDVVQNIEVLVPPLAEQKRIAGILSSLDDKIELNNKINDNLEKQAQALFKNYEECVPYCELKISDVAEINPDSYGSKDNWEYVNYLDTSSISQNVVSELQYIDLTVEKLPSRAKRKVLENDIVYSTVRPNQLHYGIICDVKPNMLVSTGFAVLRSKNVLVSNEYLYLSLTQEDTIEKLQQIAEQSTSTFPAIKPSDIGDCSIKVFKQKDAELLNRQLSAVFKKILSNNQENLRLTTLRDTLLPKLMSGEIDVENIQI